MKKFFKKIINVSAVGSLFQGTVVTFQPLSDANGNNLAGPLSQFFTSGNLPGFFNAAFTLALSAGAILAVLRLAYAGWLYMGAADMWGSKQHAKEVIMDAVLGLLLLIGIYLILNQINPNILNLNILQNISGSNTTSQTSQVIQIA